MSEDLINKWEEHAQSTKDLKLQVCRPISDEEYNQIANYIATNYLSTTVDLFLDAGCGNGLLLSKLPLDFNRVYGVDVSQTLIKQAKKLITSGNFSVNEVDALPYPDSLFEVVMCYSIFHYFPSIEYAGRVIKELLRVLKKGGRLILGDILNLDKRDELLKLSTPEDRTKMQAINRFDLWLFYDKSFFTTFRDINIKVNIFYQPKEFKTSYYRFDVIIDKL